METRTISHDELASILMDIRGATMVTIVAQTMVRLPKRSPFHGATKIATVNGCINWIYENSVNRQREHEGIDEAFQSMPRAWGTRLRRADGSCVPLVEHKGQFYLELRPMNSLSYAYYLGDRELSAAETSALHAELGERTESARQGVERVIRLRDYSLTNIREITMNGVHYLLT